MRRKTGSKNGEKPLRVATTWEELLIGAKKETINDAKEEFRRRADALYTELLEAGLSFSEIIAIIYAHGVRHSFDAMGEGEYIA